MFTATSVFAQQKPIDYDSFRNIGISLHIIELVLAVYIGYMALKFFHITKPVNLFLLVYVSIGFFIINSAIYLLFYLSVGMNLDLDFIQIYLGSRIPLIGMLVSMSSLFYTLNRAMKKTAKT